MDEGEGRMPAGGGVDNFAEGFRVTNPDLLCVDSWVHYAPDATMTQLEPKSDMVYDAVASALDGVWTVAKTYARQAADPEDETITPPQADTPTLRALCPGLWRQPDIAWEAIRNLIRNGAIQQKKGTRGLMLFIPQKLEAGGRGKAATAKRGGSNAGGVNKIQKRNGS